MGCTFLLSGEIEKGDSETLVALVGSDGNRTGGRICLNSPGGSLVEGVKLAEAIRSIFYFGTAVAEGHVCESACAVAFMAGGSSEGPASVSPIMHPQSVLGFHAPSIDFSDGNYDASEMKKSWNSALWAVAQIVKMRSEGYEFPDALLIQWLNTPPESMFYIDTVGKASKAGIYIYPVGINSISTKEAVANICSAVDHFGDNDEFIPPPIIRKLGTSQIIASFSEGFQEELTEPCTVNLNIDQISSGSALQHPRGRPIEVSFNSKALQSTLDDYFDYEAGAFPYMSYPSDTLLRDLPYDIEKSWNDFMAKIPTTPIDADRQENRQCLLGSDTSRIINVKEYVNLRDQPNFEASILRQIPLNERVFIPSGGGVKALGSEAGVKECVSACKVFSNNRESSSARDRVNKCINDNAIWYEITDERGNRGWVSRKYLSDEE